MSSLQLLTEQCRDTWFGSGGFPDQPLDQCFVQHGFEEAAAVAVGGGELRVEQSRLFTLFPGARPPARWQALGSSMPSSSSVPPSPTWVSALCETGKVVLDGAPP